MKGKLTNGVSDKKKKVDTPNKGTGLMTPLAGGKGTTK